MYIKGGCKAVKRTCSMVGDREGMFTTSCAGSEKARAWPLRPILAALDATLRKPSIVNVYERQIQCKKLHRGASGRRMMIQGLLESLETRGLDLTSTFTRRSKWYVRTGNIIP